MFTASDCMDILGNQVHPVVRMFTNYNAFFQDGSSPILSARSVQSRFDKYEDALQHLPWSAQLPDLNVIETPWSVLESRVRSRLPSPSSVKQLEDVLLEKQRSITLATVQNLCESIPRRTQAVITGEWWPNSVLIKTCVSFTTVFIILSIPCIFRILDADGPE
jgi:hypothetical protein